MLNMMKRGQSAKFFCFFSMLSEKFLPAKHNEPVRLLLSQSLMVCWGGICLSPELQIVFDVLLQ